MVVIDTLLRPYEGVVASSCGHVNTHEAGAIESTGHKVLTVPHRNGKLDADDLREYIETFYAEESHNHMVFPGMVYISHPSEYGTLYTKNELERISAVCKAFDLPLFLDGARLGYGLTAPFVVPIPALRLNVGIYPALAMLMSRSDALTFSLPDSISGRKVRAA